MKLENEFKKELVDLSDYLYEQYREKQYEENGYLPWDRNVDLSDELYERYRDEQAEKN